MARHIIAFEFKITFIEITRILFSTTTTTSIATYKLAYEGYNGTSFLLHCLILVIKHLPNTITTITILNINVGIAGTHQSIVRRFLPVLETAEETKKVSQVKWSRFRSLLDIR
jgi:hypothetical protein